MVSSLTTWQVVAGHITSERIIGCLAPKLLRPNFNICLAKKEGLNEPVIAPDVWLDEGVIVHQPDLVNLYGCRIASGTRIGPFVEIQKDVNVGANCKISSHTFICSGVDIEDGVFIGHGVMFINDTYPRAVNPDGTVQNANDWMCLPTRVRRNSSIGSNATILGGICVGEYSLVGAGAVVTHDVPDYAIVAGVPARMMGDVRTASRATGDAEGGVAALD